MANPRAPAALTPPAGPEAERDLVSAIVDTLPVLAWTAGPDGAVDYFNGQWLAYTGLPAEEALAWRWLAAIHPDDQERTTALWRAAIASGQPAEAEMRLRRADGTYLWFLSRAVALRDDTGQVRKWYGTSTEIEDRWRAEQALRDSEHNFRQIIDSVPGLIFTTAPDGAVEFVNRPLLDYFGVGLDVLRHWQQTDHVHPDDLPRVIADATRGFASRRPFSYEERLRRHDGAYRRFRLLATPMHSPGGEVVRWYGVLTDVEEQRAAEDELSVARVRLSRAMQVAAVSELAASIAQGVMRPLEGVVEAGQACRQALAAQPLDVASALSHADGVVRDAHAAAEVVQRIRGLLRQQVDRAQPDSGG
ncbi:PAS domain-containing protein [Rubrivivax sp. RP6-9]|uniref:PAS domain-containing protein n=1 Tax=Rubrivivax sp. RP6-9 TaxID=3415750 RepID=UPI003CC689B2